jgi:hypothetical protein
VQTTKANGLIALAGLVTSVATALVVTLINMWTGFNLFTLSILFIIPAGAGLCGFAAASGYYLAAKHLHHRPSSALLIQMLVIAAFTQVLIYWLEYRSMTVDGVLVSNFATFGQYLDVTLTTAQVRMGRAGQIEGGEVGSFGYWLALIDFIGFVIGGAVVYMTLKAQPTCGDCEKYLRPALKKADSFADLEDLAPYYDNVYSNAVDSSEFAAHVGREFSAGKAEQGTLNLTTVVYECPNCFGQSVMETVQVFNGSDWKDVDELKRFLKMPSGVDVRPAFRV